MTTSTKESYLSIPDKKDKQQSESNKNSHVNDPIKHSTGEQGGKSRGAGDVDEDIRRKIIDMLIDESVRRGFSYHDIAYLLTIARLESGFNPDAANGGSSSGGIGQINDTTAADLKEYTNKPAWVKDNPLYKNIDVTNPADRFNARKGVIAIVIIYERCKAKAMRRAKESKLEKFDEFVYQYFHGGLYFDAPVIERIPKIKKDYNRIDPGIVDKYALNVYNNEISSLMAPIESALKQKGIAVLQFNHADGKPASGQKVAVIAPLSLTKIIKALYDQLFGNSDTALPVQPSSANTIAPAAGKPVQAQHNAAAPTGVSSAIPNSATATPAVAGPAPASTPVSSQKASIPPKVAEKEDSELQVLLLTTNADGSLPIELPVGTGVVNVCLLGKQYEKRAADLLKQREEAQGEQKNDAVDTSDDAAESVEDTESDATPLGLYCNRDPGETDLVRAFAKAGLAYMPELIGFKRSFVLKSPTVIDAVLAVEPKTATATSNTGAVVSAPSSPSATPEVHVISGSQPKPTNKPLANVTTDPKTASVTAVAPRATPWMDVARAEYANKVQRIEGHVDAAIVAGIKKIIADNTKLKQSIKKSNDGRKTIKDASKAKVADDELQRLNKELVAGEEKLKRAVEEMRKAQNDPKINNPRIIEYIASTDTGKEWIKSNTPIEDATAWCASFVNWCLLNSTPAQKALGSARAIDWASYGDGAPIGTPGAITVVATGGGHHVGFCLGVREGKAANQIWMLGGNQSYDRGDPNTSNKSSRITVANFLISAVVASRVPKT